MIKITHNWGMNVRPGSIWDELSKKLGREPTHNEACAEVKRILAEGHREMAEAGKLKHQKGLLR